MVGKLIAGETIGKLAQNKYTPWIIGGVVLGSLALAYFGVVRPLFCKFDILDCGEDDAEKRLMNLNAFIAFRIRTRSIRPVKSKK